ncbi:hypothetical protein HJFPF1_07663 [Paramyrothecium foliicola]|nr:hypothetical protein HJFPF1_07663 [Paramyrothecium foliicola]
MNLQDLSHTHNRRDSPSAVHNLLDAISEFSSALPGPSRRSLHGRSSPRADRRRNAASAGSSSTRPSSPLTCSDSWPRNQHDIPPWSDEGFESEAGCGSWEELRDYKIFPWFLPKRDWFRPTLLGSRLDRKAHDLLERRSIRYSVSRTSNLRGFIVRWVLLYIYCMLIAFFHKPIGVKCETPHAVPPSSKPPSTSQISVFAAWAATIVGAALFFMLTQGYYGLRSARERTERVKQTAVTLAYSFLKTTNADSVVGYTHEELQLIIYCEPAVTKYCQEVARTLKRLRADAGAQFESSVQSGCFRETRGRQHFAQVDYFFEVFSLQLQKEFERRPMKTNAPPLISHYILYNLRNHFENLVELGNLDDRRTPIVRENIDMLAMAGRECTIFAGSDVAPVVLLWLLTICCWILAFLAPVAKCDMLVNATNPTLDHQMPGFHVFLAALPLSAVSAVLLSLLDELWRMWEPFRRGVNTFAFTLGLAKEIDNMVNQFYEDDSVVPVRRHAYIRPSVYDDTRGVGDRMSSNSRPWSNESDPHPLTGDGHGDQRRDGDGGERAARKSACRRALHVNGLAEQRGQVWLGFALVEGAVPAVPVEALVALGGDGGVGAVPAALEDGAADADGPVGVAGGVELGGDGPAVLDDGVALALVDGHLEGGDVGGVEVGVVGDVDDERGGLGGVCDVAAEEDGPRVEAKVEESVLAGDGGEAGGDGRGAVGPARLGVGGRVDGEDDVDLAVRVDKRVVRDVLQVLAAVDEGQALRVGGGVVVRVEAPEGVGGPVGNVVVVVAQGAQDARDGVDDEVGDALGDVGAVGLLQVQDDLVEEGARGAEDEADVVEAGDARLVVGQLAAVEARADVLEGHVAVQGGELEDGRVDGEELLAGIAGEGDDEGQRGAAVAEVVVVGDGGEGDAGPAVGGVDELVGEHAAPVVGDGALVAGVVLALDGADDLDVAGAHAVLDRGEVVGVEGAEEPAAAREAGYVGGALEQAAQVAGRVAAVGADVPGGEGAGAVQHGAVAAARHGEADVGQAARLGLGIAEVRLGVEVGDADAAQQVADVGDGLVAAGLHPVAFLVADAGAVADPGPLAGAAH